MMVSFVPATAAHAIEAATMIRPSDPHGWTEPMLLERVAAMRECWAALGDGRVGALFGMLDISTGLKRVGATFLMTTTVAQQEPLLFARLSRAAWSELSQDWDEAHGLFHRSERCAAVWLRALGFEVIETGDPTYRSFRWRRRHV